MIPRLLAVCLVSISFATAATAQPPREIKNVVMIVADDLKASVLGCYGDKVCATPNLDRLARNGMVFQRAYCQGTWCLPSRISFMFGRYRDKENVSLGQHLQANGLSSTRVGKIFHMRVPGDIIAGTDGQDHPECWSARFNSPGPEAHTPDLENRHSTRMPHRMFVSVKGDADGTEQPDYKSASKAIELLKQSQERPFFLAVGLVRPHYPMVAPSEYFEPYGIERIEMPANWHDQQPEELDRQLPRQPETNVGCLLRQRDLHGSSGRANSGRP